MAEDAARELPNLPLEDALQLVHLYSEQGSPKDEKAARRWLVRYLRRARRACGRSQRLAKAVTRELWIEEREWRGCEGSSSRSR